MTARLGRSCATAHCGRAEEPTAHARHRARRRDHPALRSEVEDGHREADRLLVPYDRYVELWNRAYPDKKIGEPPAPLPYALAGAAYEADLEGDDVLCADRPGRDRRLFAEGYVSIRWGSAAACWPGPNWTASRPG